MPLTKPCLWHIHIDNIHLRLCQLVSWFTLLMVLLSFFIVVLRYGFNLGWIAMQESVMYLHAMVFLLGAAHTLRVNEHVRVDIFYRRFRPVTQAWVNIFGCMLFLIPVNSFILWMSWDYVAASWHLLERSQEAGGLPLVFALKSLLLVFAVSMNLQGIAELLRHVLLIKQGSAK